MIKKLREYLKSTEKHQIMQDIYSSVFISAGLLSAVYLIAKIVKRRFL